MRQPIDAFARENMFQMFSLGGLDDMGNKIMHIDLYQTLLQRWPFPQIRVQCFIGMLKAFIWAINHLLVFASFYAVKDW